MHSGKAILEMFFNVYSAIKYIKHVNILLLKIHSKKIFYNFFKNLKSVKIQCFQ